MNNDTPERIWIEDNDSAQYYDHPPRWSEGVEYVRADLLATVRREAFKEAIQWARKIQEVKLNAARDAASNDEFAAMRLLSEANGAERVIKTLEVALEAPASGKEDGGEA